MLITPQASFFDLRLEFRRQVRHLEMPKQLLGRRLTVLGRDGVAALRGEPYVTARLGALEIDHRSWRVH